MIIKENIHIIDQDLVPTNRIIKRKIIKKIIILNTKIQIIKKINMKTIMLLNTFNTINTKKMQKTI